MKQLLLVGAMVAVTTGSLLGTEITSSEESSAVVSEVRKACIRACCTAQCAQNPDQCPCNRSRSNTGELTADDAALEEDTETVVDESTERCPCNKPSRPGPRRSVESVEQEDSEQEDEKETKENKDN